MRKTIVFGLVLVLCLMLIVGCAGGKETQLMRDIETAQTLLEGKEAGYLMKSVTYDNGKRGKGYRAWKKVTRLHRIGVLLAIRKSGGGKIRVIRIEHVGNGSQTDVPRGYSVTFPKRNGVNTRYNVRGHVVLALRRVVELDGHMSEVVYTPYSPGIDTPLLRTRGREYLSDILDRAKRDLKEKAVRSRAYPGKLVSEVIPTDVAYALSMIEHIDPARFDAAGRNMVSVRRNAQELMNEVLVTVGANGEHAYAYSVSGAGARNLFQFIPRTYRNIHILYPKARLERRFVPGMDDHLNAAKASLLLFDSDLSFTSRNHREFLRRHPEAMGKYLAASYNGGPNRAARSIRKHGKRWESNLVPETECYLRKFNAVFPLVPH